MIQSHPALTAGNPKSPAVAKQAVFYEGLQNRSIFVPLGKITEKEVINIGRDDESDDPETLSK